MRIAALVEIVAELFGKLRCRELLRLVEAVQRELLAVLPPFYDGIEVLQLHRLRLGEVLVALRHVEAVEPRLLCRLCAVEEENVRRNRSIGREHAPGHADHGVQVEFRKQLLLDAQLCVVGAEEEAVGQDHRRASVLLEAIHDDRHEEVGRLGACEVGGEMALDVRLLAAAVGRIHEYDVELVALGVVEDIAQEGVGVEHLRDVQVVEEHVRDAEHVGELLLLDAVD